mmetsp:Transcript_56942/g.116528  ORF Transcript_56942/g.116528 Transcript_56942/m.116528 type:complete len:408 (-) Transcript_56942:151-1374(-)
MHNHAVVVSVAMANNEVGPRLVGHRRAQRVILLLPCAHDGSAFRERRLLRCALQARLRHQEALHLLAVDIHKPERARAHPPAPHLQPRDSRLGLELRKHNPVLVERVDHARVKVRDENAPSFVKHDPARACNLVCEHIPVCASPELVFKHVSRFCERGVTPVPVLARAHSPRAVSGIALVFVNQVFRAVRLACLFANCAVVVRDAGVWARVVVVVGIAGVRHTLRSSDEVSAVCCDAQHASVPDVVDVQNACFLVHNHVSRDARPALDVDIHVTADVCIAMINVCCAVQLIEVKPHQLAPNAIQVPNNVAGRALVNAVKTCRPRNRSAIICHPHAEGRFVQHVRMDEVTRFIRAIVPLPSLLRDCQHLTLVFIILLLPVASVAGQNFERCRTLEPVWPGLQTQVPIF